MSDTVETIYTEDKQRRVRIEYDMDGSHCDPRDNEGIVEIVTPSLRRWNVRTEGAHFQHAHDELYERGLGGAFGRYLKIFHGVEAVPVFMYEHSNVALSTGSFIGRAQHAEWDSGMIGWAYIKPDTEKWEGMEPEKVMASFVSELGKWMDGEVFGWIVEKKIELAPITRDEDGTVTDVDYENSQEDWEEEESCWGYIGYDWAIQAAKTEGLGMTEEEAAK